MSITFTIPLPSERPTLPIWPDAGQLLGYSNRSSAYRAAAAGHIPTIQLSERRRAVPTAAVRVMLGLSAEGGPR
jgi:hypothetical protein